MKLHSPSVLLLLAAAGITALSCASEDPGTSTDLGPSVTPGSPAGAGGTTGTAGGGTAAGAAGGTVGGSQMGGTTGGSTSGPGGTITSVTVEQKPCEKKVRNAGKTIPDFMIVLDRSGSMRPQAGLDCSKTDIATAILCGLAGINCADPMFMGTTSCGGTNAATDRWTPAVAAVKSLTKMFEKSVNFGLVTFPGMGMAQGGGGRNNQGCSAGDQRVPVGPNTADAIAMALDATRPEGNTPTAATLDAVLKQIMAKKTSPDDVLPPQYVLLVTDGQPTCGDGNVPHQQTVAAIDALAKAGVKTYVIGYDASVNARLAQQLTEYAQHGGTNNFFAVQDGPSLVQQFTAITSVVAECSYQLDKKPDDPRYVKVELDGNQLIQNAPDGWTITDANVTIQGNACTTLRDGSRPHTLAVTVECVEQPLQ